MNSVFKSKLSKAKTLKEIFTLVNEFYDTDKELGFIAKAAINSKIDMLLTAANIKPKK